MSKCNISGPSELMPEPTFPYSALFQEKLAAKKADHSYRVFRKVARMAERFPMAREFTEREKRVTVWCSNDYLGKSLQVDNILL